MSVIHRNVTRTILDSTETTLQTKTPASDALLFELTSSSNFYIGFKKPFASRYFHFATVNTNSITVSVETWDGSAWQDVEDLVDQTLGFTRNGFVSWVNRASDAWQDSAQSPVSDKELFWARVKVSGDLSAGTSLQSVLNLFCDEDMVEQYYPELITDTRYLPDGATDFVPQLQAAKDYVVLRLKRDQLIKDESQIIDINEVAIAAVHAFRWVVLNAIARDEGDKEVANDAKDDMNYELNQVKIDLDWDDSGIIEQDEEDIGNIFIPRL